MDYLAENRDLVLSERGSHNIQYIEPVKMTLTLAIGSYILNLYLGNQLNIGAQRFRKIDCKINFHSFFSPLHTGSEVSPTTKGPQ